MAEAKAEEAQSRAKEEEHVWKEAKRVQAEDERRKKVEASAMQPKQLEQLLQWKVATSLTQEQEALRASEASGRVSGGGILGYGKGKALEKQVGTNCLRKGIECEWDDGGRGESKNYFF